ncbi:hypothetical protein Tco_0569946 [Tanacetum coccineum]
MVYVVNGVLASGVDMDLEKDFVGFALQEMKIHPLMLLIQTLSMISQTFSPTLHNPSTNHTHASYVGTTLIMVMIVHHGYRLSMSMLELHDMSVLELFIIFFTAYRSKQEPLTKCSLVRVSRLALGHSPIRCFGSPHLKHFRLHFCRIVVSAS